MIIHWMKNVTMTVAAVFLLISCENSNVFGTRIDEGKKDGKTPLFESCADSDCLQADAEAELLSDESEDVLLSDDDLVVEDPTVWPKQWESGGEANAVAVDGSGNIYVTGTTMMVVGETTPEYCSDDHGCYEDVFLTKYDMFGNRAWTKQWGTQWVDWGYAVAVDEAGDVYVTGTSEGDMIEHDDAGCQDPGVYCDRNVFLTKLDAQGEELWTIQWGTVEGDEGYAVAVDGEGWVYVTGVTGGIDFDGEVHPAAGECADNVSGAPRPCGADMFLSKVTPEGIIEWSVQYGSIDGERATGVAIEASGSAVVTGYTDGNLDGEGRYFDIFLAKFDPNGAREWTRQWGAIGWDQGSAVTTDHEGGIYVTGFTNGPLDGNMAVGGNCSASGGGTLPCPDVFLTKFNTAGEKQWTRQWGSIGFDLGNSVAVDSLGNIFVAGVATGDVDGASFAGGFGGDIMLTKFDMSGERLWTKLWGGLDDDRGKSVVVDTTDTMYMTGQAYFNLVHPEMPATASTGSAFLIRELPEAAPVK